MLTLLTTELVLYDSRIQWITPAHAVLLENDTESQTELAGILGLERGVSGIFLVTFRNPNLRTLFLETGTCTTTPAYTWSYYTGLYPELTPSSRSQRDAGTPPQNPARDHRPDARLGDSSAIDGCWIHVSQRDGGVAEIPGECEPLHRIVVLAGEYR
mmetsp:Transcript_17194/g.21099  ORF Transcript_17194/g.21099 Transcript_17194/m.21099 type:complete len:157 (+) Transcript_17194:170-640(+)